MRHNPRLMNSRDEPLEELPATRLGRGAMAISASHHLLSNSWTADVEALEVAIGGFRADSDRPNNCDVVFFEIAGDRHLHVNVTHRYATNRVSGWAGPGKTPNGYIHNRRFADTARSEMIELVRDMVLASRT